MKKRTTVALAIAMLIASGPAFAAAPASATTPSTAPAATTTAMAPAKAKAVAKKHYYVVQAAATKACSVTTKKPDGTATTMVGKYRYSSAAKAKAAMKKAADCKAA